MDRPGSQSLLRAAPGVVSLIWPLVVLPSGFVLLISDAPRQVMTRAVSVLMAGGFLLAFGIALLIWEVSGRYGIKRWGLSSVTAPPATGPRAARLRCCPDAY